MLRFFGERPRSLSLAAAAILLLGFVLRLEGARGTLWLDEIWTILLIRNIGASPLGVFLDLAHDNNHHLNTLWMTFVGPYAPEVLIRAPAVIFGTIAIAAAGAFFGPRRPAAMLAAMFLTATSYAFVNYGSEARGYGAMHALFLIVACLVKRELEAETPSEKRHLLIGAYAVAGAAFHLGMLHGLAVLGLWATWCEAERRRSWTAGLRSALTLFAPSLFALALFGTCIAVASFRYGFTFGGRMPNGLRDLLAGYGLMLAYTYGLPVSWHPAGIATAAMAVAALACTAFRRERDFRLYALGILLLPLLIRLSGQPSTGIPRYHFITAVLFGLMLADLFGRLAVRGRAPLAAALLAAAWPASVNASHLERFFSERRGDFEKVLAVLSEAGRDVIASTDPGRGVVQVEFYAARLGMERPNIVIEPKRACSADPRWLLTDVYVPRALRERPCGPEGPRFEPFLRMPFFGLSGDPIEIWKRKDP